MELDDAIRIYSSLKDTDVESYYMYEWLTELKKYREENRNNQKQYCDRNICFNNEMNGIECKDCEVNKSLRFITESEA